MMTHELGPRPEELTFERPQLIVPTGIVAVRAAIAETFARADEYARNNEDLIGLRADQYVSELQILHHNPETLERTKFGIDYFTEQDVEPVHSIDVDINRGTIARDGYPKIDSYTLTRYDRKHDDPVLTLNNYGPLYDDIKLVVMGDDGEYEFGKGIGPKRQMRALNILKIMQARIHQFSELGA